MKKNIIIFDTTLRDGEQSPGAAMTVEQKVNLAVALERLGVDRIEAGFPVSSPLQFDAVKRIAETVRHATIVALARCVAGDIEAAHAALEPAAHKMAHVFLATSPLHRRYKLKMSKAEVLRAIADNLTFACRYFEAIEFSAEDASRTEPDFLYEVVRTAIAHGATAINIPDTVGYAVPDEYGALIRGIVENVPEIKAIDLSVHCHNDLGLAVANSQAALHNGANQVEVTLNGIGERAGNCSLEELVMALHVRGDVLPFTTHIKTELLYPTSKLLQNITGLLVARNKPIFGENVFSHESGIHQDGVIKKRETYEIMKPQHIGRVVDTLIMGRHSGKHSLRKKLAQYGIVLKAEDFDRAFEQFTRVADLKKEVYDEDIFTIVATILGNDLAGYELDYFHTYTGNTMLPAATVRLKKDQAEFVASATGDGPVDALLKAIDLALGVETHLQEYVVQAIGCGQDAQGQVKVGLAIGDQVYAGKGLSTDIIEASALAYLNAFNRYYFASRAGHAVMNKEGDALWATV